VRPHDDDRLCSIEHACNFRTEAIARTQADLIPPDRARAESVCDNRGEFQGSRRSIATNG
jgi:hypothetical protein